jgi:hypothetical protein
MTVAETRPTLSYAADGRSPVSLERSLARVDELLVGRANTGLWWSALSRAVDDVGRAFAAHRAQGAGPDGLHVQILEQEPRLAFDVRGLERDHEEVAQDIAELRELLVGCPHQPSGMAQALAATTEVVARIRGYQRRLSTVLHEVYLRDLGASG